MTIANLILRLQRMAQDIRGANASGKVLTWGNLNCFASVLCAIEVEAKMDNVSDSILKEISQAAISIQEYAEHLRNETVGPLDLPHLADFLTCIAQLMAQEIPAPVPNSSKPQAAVESHE